MQFSVERYMKVQLTLAFTRSNTSTMHFLHLATLPLLVLLLYGIICAFFSKTRGLRLWYGALIGFFLGPLSFFIVERRALSKQTPESLRIESENRRPYAPVKKTLGDYKPSRNEVFQFISGTVGLAILAIMLLFAAFSLFTKGKFVTALLAGSAATSLALITLAILVRCFQRRRKTLSPPG